MYQPGSSWAIIYTSDSYQDIRGKRKTMPAFLKGARKQGGKLNSPKSKKWKQNVKTTKRQKKGGGGGSH